MLYCDERRQAISISRTSSHKWATTTYVLTRNNILWIVLVIILDEAKAVHELNFHDVTIAVLLEKVLDLSLSDFCAEETDQ